MQDANAQLMEQACPWALEIIPMQHHTYPARPTTSSQASCVVSISLTCFFKKCPARNPSCGTNSGSIICLLSGGKKQLERSEEYVVPDKA